MLRSFPTLLSVILLITANACNGLSNLRRVAYENASAISADAIPSPPGCCTGSQTYQCCGGICCAGNEICELGECISKDIVNSGRLIRFKLDWKKNGLLLRNMCNGMQGKNTATLTYSGQLSPSARAAKQRAAGCVSGYCRSLINNGTNTSDLDSCNEFPPASSNEGGDTRPANERAFSCIPGYQNCIQGATFRSVYQGTKIQAGQQFVISINCEEVFDSKVKRGLTGDSSYEPTKRSILQTRDTINMTGTTNANDTFNLATNATPYISAPFGDLEAGAYTAQVQIVSGSTTNSVVIANEGNSFTNESVGMAIGQSKQFLFNLQDSDIGVGIIFSVLNNTVIEWTLQGTSNGTATSTSTASSTASPTRGSSSGALSIATTSSMHLWQVVIGIIMLQILS